MTPGPVSLVPVVLAIGIAMATRQVMPALFSGVFAGVLIINAWRPVAATTALMKDYLLVQLTDSYNGGVLLLIAFIGGFVALMEQSGGAAAFARDAARLVTTRARVQLGAWVGGVVIFFSDLGTPLIVGPVFESLADRLRVSREKLAYVLDSTSSPVAVLVPITGWGVYVMGLIQKEYQPLGIGESDWTALVSSLPFAFYPILAVVAVPAVALLGLDVGRMARAEARVVTTGEVYRPEAKPLRRSSVVHGEGRAGSIVIFVPLAVLFATLFGILAPAGFPFAPVPGNDFRAALAAGYFFAALALVALMWWFAVRSFDEIVTIYSDGIQRIVVVAVILLLAWTLGVVNRELGTATYIVNLARGAVSPALVPAMAFLVCIVISFSTGSSWGTFAITFPIVIPMAHALGAPMHVSIASVLAGSVWGDHCSPISDSTILRRPAPAATTSTTCRHSCPTRSPTER
jgi:Na+/H+ antiporter NhaC